MDNNYQIGFTPTPSPVGEQTDIFNNLIEGYTGAIGEQTTVPNLINQYDTQFGVPTLQQGIQEGTALWDMLGSQILGVPEDIAQRSQESILTGGQKNRMIQSEQAPMFQEQGILGQNLSRMGQNLATAQTNASRMVEAEQMQQAKELQPWLQAFDNEQILSSMRMTGWSFVNQSELTRLLANQQAGITLSEGEMNRLNQLSIAEKGFAAQLEQLKESGNQARMTKKSLPDLGTLYSTMFK